MVGDRHDKWYMTEPRVILILSVLPEFSHSIDAVPLNYDYFCPGLKPMATNTSVAHFIIKPFKCLHIDHSLGTWFPLLHPSIPHSSLQMLLTSLVPPSLKLSPLIPLISSLLVRPLQTQEGRNSQTYMHCMPNILWEWKQRWLYNYEVAFTCMKGGMTLNEEFQRAIRYIFSNGKTQ